MFPRFVRLFLSCLLLGHSISSFGRCLFIREIFLFLCQNSQVVYSTAQISGTANIRRSTTEAGIFTTCLLQQRGGQHGQRRGGSHLKGHRPMLNRYTLFDGLAYNTCRYFACCVVFFQLSLARARKNTSNEKNVRSYYMLNDRITGLLFHCKKNCYFAIGFYFFGF